MPQTLDFRTAHSMLDDPVNCFHSVTKDRHLTLPPRCFGKVKEGIKEQLNKDVSVFCDSLDGVVVCYSHLKLLSQLGRVVGSQPCLHVNVRATYIIFKPTVGSLIKGIINRMGTDFLGMLVHGIFNITVPRPRDQDPNRFTLGQEEYAEVSKVYKQNGLLSLRATLKTDSFAAESYKAMKRKAVELESSMNASNASTSQSPMHKRHRSEEEEGQGQMNGELSPLVENADSHSKTKKKKKDKKKKKIKEDPDGDNVASSQDYSLMAPPQFTSTPAASLLPGCMNMDMDNTMLELNPGKNRDISKNSNTNDHEASDSFDSGIEHNVSSDGLPKKKKKKKSKHREEVGETSMEVVQNEPMDTSADVMKKHKKSKKSKKIKMEVDD